MVQSEIIGLMQKLLVEVLCPVLCKRSGYHSWMASSVLRICKTQVFQLPKFFPHFTSFLSFLQWDEWFLKMKIINIFKISINSDKDWVSRGQYGESESLAWDSAHSTAALLHFWDIQPDAGTTCHHWQNWWYFSILFVNFKAPGSIFILFYFFSVSKAQLLKFLLNKKYEKKIGLSCVQTTETHTNDQPKYLANHSSCILATFNPNQILK